MAAFQFPAAPYVMPTMSKCHQRGPIWLNLLCVALRPCVGFFLFNFYPNKENKYYIWVDSIVDLLLNNCGWKSCIQWFSNTTLWSIAGIVALTVVGTQERQQQKHRMLTKKNNRWVNKLTAYLVNVQIQAKLWPRPSVTVSTLRSIILHSYFSYTFIRYTLSNL